MANGQGGIAETVEFAAGEIQRMWAAAEEADLTGLKCPMPVLLDEAETRKGPDGFSFAAGPLEQSLKGPGRGLSGRSADAQHRDREQCRDDDG
jgi:hypothetical protein